MIPKKISGHVVKSSDFIFIPSVVYPLFSYALLGGYQNNHFCSLGHKVKVKLLIWSISALFYELLAW